MEVDWSIDALSVHEVCLDESGEIKWPMHDCLSGISDE
jgi:hypothetical protein